MLDHARSLFNERGAVSFGASRFERVLPFMRRDAAERTAWGRTLLCGAFPYYAGDDPGANISLYARGKDYHLVVGGALDEICRALSARFPGCRFERFCDSGTLPEVTAARLCGAAYTGINRLAFAGDWGSFVFLGFVLTDIEEDLPDADAGYCPGCGECIKACPTGALSRDGFAAERCLSSISQKKGDLTPEEESALISSPLIWGCDACQIMCPLNRTPLITPLLPFHQKTASLSLSELKDLSNRTFKEKYPESAFTWRGVEVLKRNLRLKQNFIDNKNEKK